MFKTHHLSSDPPLALLPALNHSARYSATLQQMDTTYNTTSADPHNYDVHMTLHGCTTLTDANNLQPQADMHTLAHELQPIYALPSTSGLQATNAIIQPLHAHTATQGV